MRLATLRRGGRDGTLAVLDASLRRAAVAGAIAPTLQAALDDWGHAAPRLEDLARALEDGAVPGLQVDGETLAAPLPRAYQWLDGSAYLAHVERVRRARGAEPPPGLREDPLMYQGCSAPFLGPRDSIPLADPAWGLDFEAEVAVVTDDVPQGATVDEAGARIRLLMLVNDISLRNLIPGELAKGFGFLQSKPASACSPAAVTPDELGEAWRGHRLHLDLVTELNRRVFGYPDAGRDMHFDFARLVAHAARTRPLGVGTVLGGGTVSNVDAARGSSCIVERRMLEVIEHGAARTPFLEAGDRVRIEMRDGRGRSVFGAIEQVVERWPA